VILEPDFHDEMEPLLMQDFPHGTLLKHLLLELLAAAVSDCWLESSVQDFVEPKLFQRVKEASVCPPPFGRDAQPSLVVRVLGMQIGEEEKAQQPSKALPVGASKSAAGMAFLETLRPVPGLWYCVHDALHLLLCVSYDWTHFVKVLHCRSILKA
jgi:hypothetical protein